MKKNELALFAGAGGGILGGHLLGWRTICAVEWEPYAACVLAARQNDQILPPFPIWDDVQTFDGHPWRGIVDVVSGGFPCQDISSAGNRAGIDGKKSGMWHHMARIIGEVRPQYVYVENSPMLTTRGLSRVLGDLAALGFDAKWGVVSAADVGAPHKRDRIWIVANAHGSRGVENSSNGQLWPGWAKQSPSHTGGCNAPKTGKEQEASNADNVRKLQPQGVERNQWGRISDNGEELANSDSAQFKGRGLPGGVYVEHANFKCSGNWWATDPADAAEPGVGRVAHGVAARVDRLKAIGNGQVPAVAATAWGLLNETP